MPRKLILLVAFVFNKFLILVSREWSDKFRGKGRYVVYCLKSIFYPATHCNMYYQFTKKINKIIQMLSHTIFFLTVYNRNGAFNNKYKINTKFKTMRIYVVT